MKSFIKMCLQIIRRLDYIVLYVYYRLTVPIQDDQVLFLSDSRKTMTGNFAFIYEYIKNDYDIKMYLDNHSLYSKRELCHIMATSHYILVDDFYPMIYPIPLRKESKLIQVWHAVGAFKTVGYARRKNHDQFSMTHRNYTDVIVSSPNIRMDYAESFRVSLHKVHSIGIPRTDIFFDKEYIENKKNEIYKRYPQLIGKRVILFAPTFRGNNVHQAYYDYQNISFTNLKESLSDEYFCIFKMHPFVKNKPEEVLDPQFYLDLTFEREINDLLFVTDILITDYSSVIFEASLLNIKTIFFAYDLEEYIASRDFYYDYEKYTYGIVVKNQHDLVEAILNPKIDEFKKQQFKDYFMQSCDGHATERFVKTLLKGEND